MTMSMQLIELATSLNRFRSLDDRESEWLESAMRQEMRRDMRHSDRNLKQRWRAKDDLALKRGLSRGRHPRDIGRAMGRSEDAVWSRIKVLRRAGKLASCSQSPVAAQQVEA